MSTPAPLSEFGAALRRTRKARGISRAKLARISGVSCRHIAAAEGGANVTLLIVVRLMRALQLTSISLDDDLTVTGKAEGIAPSVVLRVADDIDEAVADIQRRTATLRAYAEGKEPSEESGRLAARASTLLREFTEDVRRLDPAKAVEVLEGIATPKKTSARKRRQTA